MDFDRFLSYLPKILKETLPGESAHAKMSPPERMERLKSIDFSVVTPRKAAVMMLVYPNGNQSTLALIERNSYKGVHSSQIAFPGGKIEADDASPLYTALRETEEEIGVPCESVKIVRPFSEVYIPPSNFSVFPFLGYCTNKPFFIPDPREVASIVEFPFADFLNEQNVEMKTMATSYSESIAVPAFKIGNHYVWGATAMMLSELKEVFKTSDKHYLFVNLPASFSILNYGIIQKKSVWAYTIHQKMAYPDFRCLDPQTLPRV